MPSNNPPNQIIELRAGGPDDPDGSHTAAVLAAYFHAEHMKACRLRVWRQLALVAAVWSLVGLTTEILSRNALFVGLGLLAAVAAWAAIAEWRAAERVNRVLTEKR
jgi:hypothetical protein